MQRTIQMKYLLTIITAVTFAAAPAFADKPARGDNGQHGKPEQKQKNEQRGDHKYFGDHQRVVIQDYYAGQFRAGRCPPGLAKKRNGCMPPGQAKKWAVGHALPRDVVYYDLPPRVVVQLGAPPAGHRYVRVATDILLIAVGTGMVVDAIEDLDRMSR